MAKIYGTPIMAGGAGGVSDTLPPMVTNLAAVAGNQQITVTYKNPVSDALAGVLVVYKTGSYPTKPTDGNKVDAGLSEKAILEGLENGADYYIRVFPYNAKKQYQTLIDGATATARPSEGPQQVTNLQVSGSGASPVLTWKNPTDDPTYHETVVIQKVDSAPTSLSDGTEIYRGTGETVSANGLERLKNYYWGVFTVNAEGGTRGPVISDVYSYDFPAEPTEYSEIEEITDSTTWKLPEDGYFLICALGKSGNGGRGLSIISASGGSTICSLAAGGSGGTGSFAEKVVSGYKGDEYVFTITNSDTKVDYLGAAIINAKAGGNGTDGYSYGSGNRWVKNGSGGNGGTSSVLEGSAIQNGKPGNNGAYWSYMEQGSGSSDPGVVYGGTAVSSEYTSTIAPSETFITSSGAGGNGNANRSQEESYTNGGTGTSGKIIIYRGNTNQPSPSTVSALSLTPRNTSIEASWANSGDPESVGTILVSNSDHVPVHPTDGASVDVAEATSYTITDLPNNKPSYISLFAYNADKTKYSAAKSDVEIPREVTWYDVQEDLKEDITEAQEDAEQAQKVVLLTRDFLPDAVTLTLPEIYDEWNPDSMAYIGKDTATEDKPASIVRRNGFLYRCLQSHTSQENWTPENSPSLWVLIDDPAIEWPEWKQPTGAHDAYDLNAKVSHNGKRWISQIPANTTEPGTDERYWKECTE